VDGLQILRTGAVTVSGEDYETQVVDFSRDAALTITLSGGSRWGQTGVSPRKNLNTWSALVASKSGANPTQVVMDPLAAELFTSDSDVRTILDNRRQAGGELELAGR
jgi:hypothetical protein